MERVCLGMCKCHSGCFGTQGPWPALTWVPRVPLGGPKHLGVEQRVGGDMAGLGVLRVVTEVSVSVVAAQVMGTRGTSRYQKTEAGFSEGLGWCYMLGTLYRIPG